MILKIKLRCPTKKVNLDPEDKNHIIGMGMMIDNDLLSHLHLDKDDVGDDTIICLDRHQFLEALGVIDGCLRLMEANHIIDEDARTTYLTKLMKIFSKSSGIFLYSEFVDKLHSLDLPKRDNKAIDGCMTRLQHITRYIWFVTYSDLDRYYEQTVEAFGKEKGDKNENNGEDN